MLAIYLLCCFSLNRIRILLEQTSLKINKMGEPAKHNSLTIDRIKYCFERHIYDLDYVPRVFAITCHGVQVHKNGPNQDEIESLEDNVGWETNSFLTPKLKGCSYGDFYLYAGLIGTKYFDSREKLDNLYGDGWGLTLPVTYVERMSLKDALKVLDVDIMCDMEYYSSNLAEIEADLGHKVDNLDAEDKMMMQHLEPELFYSQAVKIFGADDEDVDQQTGQKSLMFKDFRLLYSDGNFIIATARRGSFYVLLHYSTS